MNLATERRLVRENVRRVLLKEFLMRETERAGFGGAEIQRTPMGTRVVLYCERPGLVIGRKGGAIKDLTTAIEHDFKFDNPQVEVQEIKNPALNAQIMAKKLAIALERGWQYRRAGHSTVRRIMDAGARGCQVIIAGKLTGERHRTEKFREGTIKYCGDSALKFVDKGYAVAKLKPGIMGATVWIMRPDAKLPDEIVIKEPSPVPAGDAGAQPQAAEEKTTEQLAQTPATETASAQKVPAPGAQKPEIEIKPEKVRVKGKVKQHIISELKSIKEEAPPIDEVEIVEGEEAGEDSGENKKKDTKDTEGVN